MTGQPVEYRRVWQVYQWLYRIMMGLLLAWIIFSGAILAIEFPVKDMLFWRVFPVALGCFGLAGLGMVIRLRPGTFWRLLFSSPILLGLVIVIFVPLLRSISGHLSSETLWAFIPLPADFILFLLFAWQGAQTDSPPLGSFTAPAAYSGRYAHLRDLAIWAAEQGWQATGPQGCFRELMVRGSWHSHPVSIVSAEKLHGKGDPDRFVLSTSLGTGENLWPLIAGYRASELAEKLDLEEYHGVLESEHFFDYYFRPDNDREDVDEISINQLHNTLGSGAALLGEHGLLFSSESGITLQQYGNSSLQQGKADIEKALMWMSRVITVMESQGFISK